MALLSIPDRHIAVLKKLADLSESNYAALSKALSEIRPSLSVGHVVEGLSASVPSIPSEDIGDYVALLCGLYPVMENHEKTADRVAADIKETVEETKRFGFTPDRALTVANRMRSLLSIGKGIAVTAKAVDVATEHQNVFCGVKIYSDIRPVFSAAADSVAGAVVLQNLNISYHQGHSHKEFYVALNVDEIEELKAAIERAEKKAKQLELLIRKSGIDYLE